MMVKNVFRLNDWKLSEFFIVVFSVQFALLGLELLGALGLEIPLAKPVVGFLYLTFVPGALLLRILGVRDKSGAESVLYMAGLSLAFAMLTGFLINVLYPFLGIDAPITEHSVVLSLFLGVLLLAALCYRKDRGFSGPSPVLELDAPTLAPTLLLVLLPLAAAASAYLVNAYNVNTLVYGVLLAIALVFVLCGFGRFIPARLYPLAIGSVALALLFHNAFVSNYLWSWDVHHEYNIASLVIDSGHWDTSVISYLNSMLSIVFLAPFYHFVCGLDLTWTFKIVFQLIFALVPVGLYTAFRRQAGDRMACLACLFFVSLVTFFTEMQGLTRQEIAELYLALIIMLMTDATHKGQVRAFLMAVFGMALVVSHYGLAYIYLAVFPAALVLVALVAGAKKLCDRATKGKGTPAGRAPLPVDHSLTLTFVGAFACFLFFWYLFTSDASTLRSVSYIIYKILANVSDEFLNPSNVQGLGMIVQGSASPLYNLKKYMHLAFQGCIALGLGFAVLQGARAVAGKRKYHFSVEYLALAFLNLLICVFAITVPYFASSLNTSRLYQITLIVLAPLCIIGGVELIKAAITPLERVKAKAGGHAMMIMTLAVVVYLFFNAGLIFNLVNDHPMSVALSKSSINTYSLDDRASLYDPLNTFEQDYYGAGWLADHRLPGLLVYSDYIDHYPVSSYGHTSIDLEAYYDANMSNLGSDAYVYLGYANLKGNVVREITGNKSAYPVSQVLPGLESRDKVYDSDGCMIYRVI